MLLMGQEVLWTPGGAQVQSALKASSSVALQFWISTWPWDGPAVIRNLSYLCSGHGAGEEGISARRAGT